MAHMSFRKSLLLTALSSVILLPSAANAATQAPDIHFYPTKGWNITKADHHCKIQSEFNNGFVVGFAGTQQWVDSLSINFRQNAFEKNKSYSVNIAVPEQASENIKAKAISRERLVIDFKDQKDIYKKITTSSVLDFSVEGNRFRFYLAGFAKQSKEFEHCMSGTTSSTSTTNIAPPPPENVEPQPLITTSRQSITAQNPDIFTDIEAAGMEEDIKKAVGTMPTPRKRTSNQLAETIHQNPDLIKMDNNNPAQLQSKALEKIELEVKEVEQLEPAPIKNNSTHIQTPKMKVNKESVTAEADFREVDMPAYNAVNDPKNGGLLAKISVLEEQLTALKQENVALNNDLDNSLQASEQERLEIASDNWNLESATMKYNEAERQIKRLGQQLQTERAKCKVEQRDLEAMLFDPKLTEDSQLARLAQLEEQLIEARKEIKRLQAGQ